VLPDTIVPMRMRETSGDSAASVVQHSSTSPTLSGVFGMK